MTLSLVVLASGRGSNFKAILDAIAHKKCDAKVRALITDHPDAKALDIAKAAGIPTQVVERKDFPTALAYDEELLARIDRYTPDLIVLAGYMRILRAPSIFARYGGRILNIHPSLLPKYPGAQAQADAYNAGEKESGLTIHLVDESLDGGPILYQERVDISRCRSADETAAAILAHEHAAYARVIDDIAHGKYPQVRRAGRA